MDYAETPTPSTGLRRALLAVGLVALLLVTGVASYLYARRDTSALRSAASQRGSELSQLQAQLRSAAKQNDILAREVRQGTRAIANAGTDSKHTEKRLRASLKKANKAEAKLKAKLQGLSSGLSASVGSLQYIAPAKKKQPGSIQGTMTISNSTGLVLDGLCELDVGSIKYAIMGHAIPSKGSVVESFQFPYSGPKPSGATSGGCGRL